MLQIQMSVKVFFLMILMQTGFLQYLDGELN